MRPYATSLPGAALPNGFCQSVTESWLPAFSLHLLPSQAWQTSSAISTALSEGSCLLHHLGCRCADGHGQSVHPLVSLLSPEASAPSWRIGCQVLPGSWSLQRDHTHDKGLSFIRAQLAFVSLRPVTLIRAPGEGPLNVPSLLHNTA